MLDPPSYCACELRLGTQQIQRRSNMRLRRAYLAGVLVAIGVAGALRNSPLTAAQVGRKMPTYKVDPFWPRPLPSIKDGNGLMHQWVTGEVGASCIDSHAQIITVHRGF